MKATWFKTWFNTKYYHILYKNRGHKEAQLFIDRLVATLNLSKEKCLDLACGRGRHAVYLNEKGLDVTGVDLSEESISYAKKFETNNLSFAVHDMREVYTNDKFDVVFNLFTSFGYFDVETENLKVLQSVNKMMNDNGVLVIDFMNATEVISSLKPYEVKTIENIEFHIRKSYTGKHILKNIQFEADGESFDYTEKVQALEKKDFLHLLEKAGFEVEHVFGNFRLEEYHPNSSDRLILIARKK
ncbi:MAG: class I SAM-dependent methyltransferase [Lishizhenia sp.]